MALRIYPMPRVYAHLFPLPSTGLDVERVNLPSSSELFRIGREDDNDLVIVGSMIGPHHCIIYKVDLGPDVYAVAIEKHGTDLETFVNGVAIDGDQSTLLKDGDVITLGQPEGGPAAFKFLFNRDIGEFGNKYDLGKKISQDTFSAVHDATDVSSGAKKAVKEIRTTSTRRWLEKITALKGLSHFGILNLEEVFRSGRKISIVREQFPLGNLLTHIQKQGALSELFAAFVTYQVNHALMYLHANGVVHGDLKPANIFMVSLEPALIKVADFGLATSRKSGASVWGAQGLIGMSGPGLRTREVQLMAPEIQKLDADETYGSKVDSWSLGLVVFAMLAGGYPWTSGDAMLPRGTSSTAIDFMKRLLCEPSEQRMGLREALHHVWLVSLDLPSSLAVPKELLDASSLDDEVEFLLQ